MKSFVCRCEDVTVADVEAAVAAGCTTLEEIKRYTGFGTGPCQGRECLSTVARLCVQMVENSAVLLAPFTSRPPARPVTLAALAALASGDRAARPRE